MNAHGLTTEEAKRRLEQFGPNELAKDRRSAILAEIKKILTDPMALMLLGLAVLYWFLGDRTDSIVLFIAFIPVALIDVLLELHAGRAIKALHASLQPSVRVYRDGSLVSIPSRDLVPDDLIAFQEGERLAADGKLLECENLSINEASLTGESLPIIKEIGQPFLSGTVVLTGRGFGIVEKTGAGTALGNIAELLLEVETARSPLRRVIDQFTRWIIGIAGLLTLLLFFVEWRQGKPFFECVVLALTFAMSAFPEEFPIVFTLYLSLAAWRLSTKGVLVKTLPSVETLGRVDVIGTDKTGTLTEGLFQLETIFPFSTIEDLPSLFQMACLACEPHPVDSLEAAIFAAAKTHSLGLERFELIHDYPFEAVGKHMSHVWKHRDTGEQWIVMKGAVEGVLEHCQISKSETEQIFRSVSSFSSEAKRVLGLAVRRGSIFGVRQRDEVGLTFVGLLVFSDPIRSTVSSAIERCQAAGIEIKMLTGDYLLTAHAVADSIGLKHDHDHLISGHELDQLDKSSRQQKYLSGSIFARVTPQQKFELVETLKKHGKIVAMTGDGVNDAPALKLADIGISMGKNATDVARGAAQMVLLHNDFNGIIHAVFEGRNLTQNLRRSFGYLISFHLTVFILALIPPLIHWPAIYFPVHIILLELLVHPISAFAFENLTGDGKQIESGQFLPTKQIVRTIVAGVLVSVAALYLFRQHFAESPDLGRSLALATVLFGNLSFVLSESYPAFGRKTAITVAALVLLMGVLIYFEPIAAYLHLKPIPLALLGKCFISGIVALFPKLFF